MMLALMLALIAQTPAAMPRIEDVGERRVFEEAQRALEADEALLALHRGLRAYLSTDDGLRQAEEAYDARMEVTTLRERVEDFEEVMIADRDARADFARYMARVKRDPALREAIEALGAIESKSFVGSRDAGRSFAYLRSHPQTAIPFLTQRDRGQATIEVLRPLRDAIRRNGNLLQVELRDAWTTLDAQSGAREAVYPWWARVYGADSAEAQRYRALDAELAAKPSWRRAWEVREMAWAPRPEAAAWRDHVYARVRRDPALGPIYFDYLRILRTHPEVDNYAEDAFATKHGAPPAWPPQGAPPGLAAWSRPKSVARPDEPGYPVTPSLNGPILDRPGRPKINRPATPKKPVTPQRAVEPSTP